MNLNFKSNREEFVFDDRVKNSFSHYANWLLGNDAIGVLSAFDIKVTEGDMEGYTYISISMTNKDWETLQAYVGRRVNNYLLDQANKTLASVGSKFSVDVSHMTTGGMEIFTIKVMRP